MSLKVKSIAELKMFNKIDTEAGDDINKDEVLKQAFA